MLCPLIKATIYTCEWNNNNLTFSARTIRYNSYLPQVGKDKNERRIRLNRLVTKLFI